MSLYNLVANVSTATGFLVNYGGLMDKFKFFGLAVVSIFTSMMLWIDGIYSRAALEADIDAENVAHIDELAFWRLWLPLLAVQIVIVVLVNYQSATHNQKNLIYFGVFLFATASVYALVGFQQLSLSLK